MSQNSVIFDGQRWSNAADDAVRLVEYDDTWPAGFTAEVKSLRAVLGDVGDHLVFEHVGSTAVGGLNSKPIIDLLIIPAPGTWPKDAFVSRLPSLGYVFWESNPDPWHLFFVKGMPPFGKGRTHHLHVRPADRAAPVIAFRDYLRANPAAAGDYAELKQELAAKYPHDRENYTHGKDAFVEQALRAVNSEAGDSGTHEITLCLFGHSDSLQELTTVLHQAYAAHAACGRIFFASYQTVNDTRERLSKGECWVAFHRGIIIGTVTVTGQFNAPLGYPATPRTGTFNQLAVLPKHQSRGLGGKLLALAETRIGELGADEIVIDTSAQAVELIAWYERRGYSRSGSWKWEVTNYQSTVLRKPLK